MRNWVTQAVSLVDIVCACLLHCRARLRRSTRGRFEASEQLSSIRKHHPRQIRDVLPVLCTEACQGHCITRL